MDFYRPRKRSKRIPVIIAIVAVVVAVLVISYFVNKQRHEKLLSQQQKTPNEQTDLGKESKRDDSATNTNQQNQQLSSTSPTPGKGSSTGNVAIPVPVLTKSSGNNGTSIPSGAVVEFTCSAPASYSCRISLAGPAAQTLPNKKLVDDGRTQPTVLWDWTAASGSWTVTAILSDGKGNEQNSQSQTLEVR